MVLNLHRNHKAYYRRVEEVEGGMEVGEEGDYILSLHCHHQSDSCIKMGSDERHFNVSFIVRDKVTRQCPQPQLLKRKENRSGIEPRSFRLPA